MASASESGVPQTDVSRPSALPTARLRQHHSQPVIDQASNEYLDGIEEEWNRRVDVEIETLVDGMVDIVSLAAVRLSFRRARDAYLTCLSWLAGLRAHRGRQIGDKDKFRIAQEAFQAQYRAESMVRVQLPLPHVAHPFPSPFPRAVRLFAPSPPCSTPPTTTPARHMPDR